MVCTMLHTHWEALISLGNRLQAGLKFSTATQELKLVQQMFIGECT